MLDLRFWLVCGGAILGLPILLLYLGAFDGWPEGKAAFGGALYGALVGFVGIIFANAIQAGEQRAENDRLRAQDRRGKAVALWIDSNQAIAELVVLMNQLRGMEQLGSVTANGDRWLKERGYLAATRTNELLRSNLDRSSEMPDDVLTRISRAAFAAAMLEVNISTIRIGPKNPAITDILGLLQAIEEALVYLLELTPTLHELTKVPLVPPDEPLRLIGLIKGYRQRRPFPDETNLN